MRKHPFIVAVLAAAALSGASLAMAQDPAPTTTITTAPAGPDCSGYEALAKKAYDTEQWWQTADPTPVTKSEDRRLDAFRDRGCGTATRSKQKAEYAAFFRKYIGTEKCSDGRRWANCAVATCESGLGGGGNILYGFLDYWYAMSNLPKWGHHSRSGTRFAPSASGATKLEQDVVAAAAFKQFPKDPYYGPAPGTCAS